MSITHYLAIPLLTASCLLAASTQTQHYPQLGFDSQPDYYADNEVSLTFEDGPGWQPQITHEILDILNTYGIVATFFINTGNSAMGSHASWKAIARIIEEGHELGSHTRNHHHLANLPAAQLEKEIFGVEDDIRSVLGYAPRITLFRAPFGEPYMANWNGTWEPGVESYRFIAPLVASKMVHVGWNIDSNDWRCGLPWSGPGSAGRRMAGEREGECVARLVIERLEGTSQHTPPWGVKLYGNIMFGAVHSRTVEALPAIIEYLFKNNYAVISTEQAICNKYGATSANLIDGKSSCDSEFKGPPISRYGSKIDSFPLAKK